MSVHSGVTIVRLSVRFRTVPVGPIGPSFHSLHLLPIQSSNIAHVNNLSTRMDPIMGYFADGRSDENLSLQDMIDNDFRSYSANHSGEIGGQLPDAHQLCSVDDYSSALELDKYEPDLPWIYDPSSVTLSDSHNACDPGSTENTDMNLFLNTQIGIPISEEAGDDHDQGTAATINPTDAMTSHTATVSQSVSIHRKTIESKTITDIATLSDSNDEDFIVLFLDNLDFIFHCEKSSVLNAMECRNMALLDCLRSKLAVMLQSKFPAMTSKVLCKRRVPSTYASDIFHIGHSIVNNALTLDVEKAFTRVHPSPHASSSQSLFPDDLSENKLTTLPELIAAVISLKKSVKSLEIELRTTKLTCVELSDRVAKMDDSLARGVLRATEIRTMEGHPVAEKSTETEATDVICGSGFGYALPQESSSESNDAAEVEGSKKDIIFISSTSESEASSDEYLTQTQKKRKQVRKRKRRQKDSQRIQESERGLQAATSHEDGKQAFAANDIKSHTAGSTMNVTKDIYVGNVHVESNVLMMRDYLKNHNIMVQPSNVKQLAHTQDAKSYKISIPEVHYQKVLSKERPIWPKGVKARPFYPKNQNRPPSELRSAGMVARQKDKASGRHYRPTTTAPRYSKPQHTADTEWPRLPQRHQWNDNDNWWLMQEQSRWFSEEQEQDYDQESWYNLRHSAEWYRR